MHEVDTYVFVDAHGELPVVHVVAAQHHDSIVVDAEGGETERDNPEDDKEVAEEDQLCARGK